MNKTYHDTIVVGAGPAGIQMGYLLEMANRDYLILDGRSVAGSFFTKFPRHRRLNSFNKQFNWFEEDDFNMRFDWHSLLTHDFSFRYKGYSKELFPLADTLAQYIADFREHFGIRVQFDTRVTYIDRDPETKQFILTLSDGDEIRCRSLVMATGPVKPNIPDIPGIEHAVGYEDHTTDLEAYENKRVVIVGGGNSAFETANHLAPAAAMISVMLGNNFMKHAWQTHYVGDVRSSGNAVLDMSQLKMMHGMYGIAPTRIEKTPDGTLKVHYREEFPHWSTPGYATGWIPADYVIRCTGWRYIDDELFAPSVRPQGVRNDKFPLMSSIWESSTPDMFYVGGVMDGRNQRGPNTSIHGFRYATRAVFNAMEQRYYGVPTPNRVFPLKTREDLMALGDATIERISTTSALYENHGLLADALVFDPESGTARVFYEMPIDYFLENPYFTSKKTILSTLEFGYDLFPDQNPNAFIRRNDPARPGCVAHLHPVFRFFDKGEFVKGRNTRAATTTRYDSAASMFEGDSNDMKPRHIVYNFINEIAGTIDEVFPEDTFFNTEDRGGFFPLAEGEVLTNPGLPVCGLTADGPQVLNFPHLTMGERNADGTIPPWRHCK